LEKAEAKEKRRLRLRLKLRMFLIPHLERWGNNGGSSGSTF